MLFSISFFASGSINIIPEDKAYKITSGIKINEILYSGHLCSFYKETYKSVLSDYNLETADTTGGNLYCVYTSNDGSQYLELSPLIKQYIGGVELKPIADRYSLQKELTSSTGI